MEVGNPQTPEQIIRVGTEEILAERQQEGLDIRPQKQGQKGEGKDIPAQKSGRNANTSIYEGKGRCQSLSTRNMMSTSSNGSQKTAVIARLKDVPNGTQS